MGTLTEVDYGLLMLFIGQFLLIGSFDDTGVPQSFLWIKYGQCADQMTEGACVYWFVMIVTILSNVAVCQMLAATFPYATPYDWLQVSFSATIAGNLTMLGSAANMIVAFQAAKVGDRTFTSERHAPFGIPSTLLSLYAGTFLLATFPQNVQNVLGIVITITMMLHKTKKTQNCVLTISNYFIHKKRIIINIKVFSKKK